MPTFRLVGEHDSGRHHYAHYECVAATEDGLGPELSAVVRELYAEPAVLATLLRDAAAGLGHVADDAAIDAMVEEVVGAVVPPGVASGRPGRAARPAQLELSRNELGEVIAHLAAQEIYGTVVPAKRVRNKEVSGMPSRGMDLLGIDLDPLSLILGEVKTSESTVSPPAVVGVGDDSLRGQLLSYVATRDRVIQALNWTAKHAPADHRPAVLRAMFMYLKNEVPIVVFAALIRPAAVASATDFGCFQDDPEQFMPGAVRFCLVSLAEPISDLARDVYDQARMSA